jgi:hypothetical protein
VIRFGNFWREVPEIAATGSNADVLDAGWSQDGGSVAGGRLVRCLRHRRRPLPTRHDVKGRFWRR